MSGTKPSTVKGFILVRDFRGARVYLSAVHGGKGMHWSADRGKAFIFDNAQTALDVKDIASRDWGAACVVIDTSDDSHIVERAPASTFRVEVIADETGKWLPNGMTFETRAAAETYAANLAGRWTAVRSTRVVQS